MKINISVLASALLFGALLLSPKQVTAQSSKPESVVSLTDFRNQLSQLQGDVSATVNSLNAVKGSAKNAADLTKASAELDSRFKTLEAHVETVRTNAILVKARVRAHYEAWSKELTAMQNASLREKAQDRLTRSQKEFDKISAEAADAKEEVLPFVSSVKDIVIYLNADLSEEAVNSLSGTIWKLNNKSKSVIGSIGDVIEEIDSTIKSLPQR
jgi:archaellum component FlaC